MLTAPASTVMRARRLRRTMSPAEMKLWYALRERPGGYKFRKSHPAGFFALDFFCAQAKLAIEVDGESHSRGDQVAFDEQRDRQLQAHGIETLRIGARDVFSNLDGVVTHIVEAVRARLPLHHPPEEAGGPPPRAGEDK